MKKLLGIILLVFLLSANANAGSDGQDDLSKNKNGEVKDCFESINRGIFAFNQVLQNTYEQTHIDNIMIRLTLNRNFI